MKNLVIILSIATIILSSCSSSKHGIVFKRKYTKGFYVAHHSKKNSVKAAEENKQEVNLTAEVKRTIELSKVISEVKETTTSKSNEKSIVVTKPLINEVKHNTISVDSKAAVASAKPSKIKTLHKIIDIKKKASKSSGGSDSNLILLVILSIFPFFALLAMYLKDGKKITLNFWVDLILHITLIGYIIFALLVVFDIINLA